MVFGEVSDVRLSGAFDVRRFIAIPHTVCFRHINGLLDPGYVKALVVPDTALKYFRSSTRETTRVINTCPRCFLFRVMISISR